MTTGPSRGGLFALLILTACLPFGAPQAVHAQESVAPGQIEVGVRDGQVTLRTRQVPLRRVIDALGEAAGVDIRADNVPERLVTVDYAGITVEQTLDRLGVNYVLLYRRPKDGGRDRLTGAWMVRTGLTPAMRAFAARILEQIGQLRDDDIRGNALEAWYALLRAGDDAMPYLEQALHDDDYQTRQFAADVLHRMDDRYQPSLRFLEVLIEGMRDDAYPYGTNRRGEDVSMPITNARRAYEYFTSHPAAVDLAEGRLAAQLHGNDPQQRFLVAVILAEGGRTAYAPRLAAILAPHLADNDLGTDATIAAYALGQLGARVRSYLEPHLHSPDPQQAALVEHILYHIDNPGAAPRRPRGEILSSLVLDPVAERRPHLHMWGWRSEQFPKLD